MMYVIIDNYAGGCMIFDNKEDCKKFVKHWHSDSDYDATNYTVYEINRINPTYSSWVNSLAAEPIDLT